MLYSSVLLSSLPFFPSLSSPFFLPPHLLSPLLSSYAFFFQFMSETWGQWYQGVDNSGDITLWENVEGLIEVVRRELGEVYLVRRGRGGGGKGEG